MRHLSDSNETRAVAAPLSLPWRAGLWLVLISLVWVVGLARAQATDAVKPDSYQAAKTVSDYQQAVGQPKADDFDYAANPLRVEVWLDRPQGDIYRKGEELSVGLQTNEDAYAVVYRIDTEGLVTILWPRSRLDDGFIFGGHEYQLPVSGAKKLRVSEKEGEGIVEAVVSRYPFDLRPLELDFHHERRAETFDFRVAGDPFLAMNEVNYAITGLEDSGEYVVTNYASYYVHQQVDHPRYLCSQCHIDDEVAYDPYRDDCTLTIEYDYSWYNGWYDNYGYYPVYGNPVYVYVDPWSLNPWVNYWYRPAYSCAPWSGWGWGWGNCYSWSYSPYYWGDSVIASGRGYNRYRPLDRSQLAGAEGRVTKTREYRRGSAMVGRSEPSARDRSSMVARTVAERGRGNGERGSRSTIAARTAVRGGSTRGTKPVTRQRIHFDQVSVSGRHQSGLRIRENVRTPAATGGRSGSRAARQRHTAAGEGQRPGLTPVRRGSVDDNRNWRGTTRVGSGAVGAARSSGRVGGNQPSATAGSRGGDSAGSKAVRSRSRSTRVWTAPSGRSGSRSTADRGRSGKVTNRGRSSSSGAAVKRSKPSSPPPAGRRSSGSTVKKRAPAKGSSSRGSNESKSNSSRGSGGRSQSKGARSGGARR